MRTRILILCTGNSARSQMAEGWMKSFDSGLEVYSAGTDPAAQVHPAAVEAMREAGIDISANRPKRVDRFLGDSFDYVITVCDHANETCPAFVGKVRRRLHAGFYDPAKEGGAPEQVLAGFRTVRDEIREYLGELFEREIRTGLRPAAASDFDPVAALLRECALPTDGLAEQFGPGYVVAFSGADLIGVAGMEAYGEDGLLRSVAVAPTRRDSGAGKEMVLDRLASARMNGLRAVYLLTTTAEPYFQRLGFETISRDAAPEGIRGCREFREACPASAAFMRFLL